jgi:outer membrane receptor protein involved in Fe transport
VSAAAITIIGGASRATTDVSGRFRLERLPSGAQRLVIRAIGLLPETTTVNAEEGRTTTVQVTLRRSPTTLGAVAVTAQKRTESLQEVPVAVTAYDNTFLKTQSVQQFDQLSDYVPGLNVQMQSPNNPGFVVRGITSDDGSSFVEPRVSVFQDGVSISKSRGSVVELFDLERVEVLKGPQGTLFGRGAQIGAVHVIQNKASNRREGSLTLGGGNVGELYANGVVNAPLVDNTLFGRVAVIYNKRDGFIKNVSGGTLNGKNTAALRASLRWLPSQSSTVDLIVNAQNDNSPGTSFKNKNYAPPGGDTTAFGLAALNGGDSLKIDRQVGGVTLLWSQQLSRAWTMTSTSAWRRFYSDENFDADGTLAPVLQFHEIADGSQGSQELRFNYDQGGKLTAFMGTSLFWEQGSQRVPFTTDERSLFALISPNFKAFGVPFIPLVKPDGTANLSLVNNPLTGKPLKTLQQEQYQNYGQTSAAEVFIDATYKPISPLSLTAGIRGTYEKVKNGYEVTNSATPGTLGAYLGAGVNDLFAPTNGRKTGEGNFRSAVGRAIASYDFGNGFLGFASVSKGRRPNVVSVTAAGPRTLSEETVMSYETGLKGQLLNGRVQFDANAYNYRYNNFQTSITRLTSTGVQNTTLDAGRAKSWGLEGSARAQLSSAVSVFATYGYIDAKFDSLDSQGNKQARAGNRFRLTPMQAYSAGLNLSTGDASFGRLFVAPNLTYRGKIYFEDTNLAGISQDGTMLFNVRAGYALPNRHTEITLLVRNLLDKKYIIDAGNTGGAFGIPSFIAGAPRFVSLQLSQSF